ncbi:PepSY domain-containing protein [Rheinheimera sp. YQF-2]|uniref:PepSY domain-containing protein n=1 Tax=Rheinheimera lutimaris TaxID=2740584 RepID=A0A7Y5EIM6_9GAMM|nr:PepSY domain-containing protein [Rheinheimera lutimaris]NRQ43649.1 PepSY domain-containing protein [Rheinheimera lutimaris]
MKHSILMSVILTTAISWTVLADDDKPAANTLKLSEVIKQLEQQGYNPIADVEFDDNKWEIDAWRGNDKRELTVDPVSGKILRDRDD